MYNYIYNNVVDLNNAINSYWPQVEDKATEGNDINIPTGNDYLSPLPPEILTEIMTHLSIEDVHALSLTNRKIKPTTKPVIQFKTNLKTQNLFESYSFSKYSATSKREIYIKEVEKAKIFQNGSNERVQALRDAICSLYSAIDLSDLLRPLLSQDQANFKDKLLVEKLMKGLITYEHDLCNFGYYNYVSSHRSILQNVILFLNLLKTNQFHPKELEVQFICSKSVPSKLIETFVEALCENHTINSVKIKWDDCNLIQLEAILEAVKNNERIVKFQIEETGSTRRCSGYELFWQKNAKEKSYKEFQDLIKNKLNSTFQILEREIFCQFTCQRLPV